LVGITGYGSHFCNLLDRVVVQLISPERGLCGSFFPIQRAPPLNSHANIMCLCLIFGHFLHVYLKDNSPIPLSCMEWNNHMIGEAEQREFAFKTKYKFKNSKMYLNLQKYYNFKRMSIKEYKTQKTTKYKTPNL
jgi:hypothetical protein